MNLRFVETFLWVARLGSFSAAAEKLNTTQAAISNRISTLERDLGVQLFERDARSVRLTIIGQKAVAKAEALIVASSEFRDAISGPASLSGTISIGTIDSITHAWLPQFIESVRREYPGVTFDLNVDTSLNITHEIIERKIDLALVMGPVISRGLTNIDLGETPCIWVASPTFGLSGRPLNLADISEYPILAFSKNSVPHHRLLQQFRALKIEPPLISHSNSLATIIHLVRDGVGIAPLPANILEEQLKSGNLVELDVSPSFDPLHLHAVYADHQENLIPAILGRMAQKIASEFNGSSSSTAGLRRDS